MHGHAPLSPEGRWRPGHRIAGRWSITTTAGSMSISGQGASDQRSMYGRLVGADVVGVVLVRFSQEQLFRGVADVVVDHGPRRGRWPLR
jgi:hypothetical protein